MMLTAEDFLAEQTYFREKIKLHNRLHGYGVVCGLQIEKVDVEKPEPCKHQIIVKPGMAIDWNGNEIIVCKEQTVDLSDKCRQLFSLTCADCPGGADESGKEIPTQLYIGIKYAETMSDPEAVYATDCGCDQKRCEFSRVQEGFCIGVFLPDELPWQPPQMDCVIREEHEHYVMLGMINFDGPQIFSILDLRQYVPFNLLPLVSSGKKFNEFTVLKAATIVKAENETKPVETKTKVTPVKAKKGGRKDER